MRIDEIKEAVGAVLSHHAEVELAVLFGSRARNAARSGSDVDLAVVGGPIDALGLSAGLSDAAGAPVRVFVGAFKRCRVAGKQRAGRAARATKAIESADGGNRTNIPKRSNLTELSS